MGGISVWHWLTLIFWVVVIAVPVTRILGRTGHSKWWAFLAFVPFLNLVFLWLFAFTRWPRDA